ncbi:MAG: anthrax toxin lethal factor-related metalloendopeptidase, partial [Myxococcales bacterium]
MSATASGGPGFVPAPPVAPPRPAWEPLPEVEHYALTFDEATAAVVYDLSQGKTWMPATFIADGQRYEVSLRQRGQGARYHPKHSWHVKFPDGVRFRGVKRLKLAAEYLDAGYLSDVFSYGLMNAAHVIAPRAPVAAPDASRVVTPRTPVAAPEPQVTPRRPKKPAAEVRRTDEPPAPRKRKDTAPSRRDTDRPARRDADLRPAVRDATDVVTPRPPATDPTPRRVEVPLDRAELVRQVVRPGGSATAEDVAAFMPEIEKIPTWMLESARRKGVSIVVCRDNVTDHIEAYRGQRPRGWPPGSDWSRVPGVYSPERREVVVSTTSGPDGRRVPRETGDGHGAFSLLLHEFAHGLDRTRAIARMNSNEPGFLEAYAADAERMRADGEAYLLQPGDAGREEAFAE